jgi:hypothetical protein
MPVTAIDRLKGCQRARTRVQHNLRNVRVVQMDATKLKFPDNSFDIVFAPQPSVRPRSAAVTRDAAFCKHGGRQVF